MIENEESARRWLIAGIGADNLAISRLEELSALLLDENCRQNLVAPSSLPHIWVRHIADSAQLLLHLRSATRIWLDLGSGAGFPGLVVAILRPDIEVYLVESRRKRIEWLERAGDRLGLANTRVLGQRLETLESIAVDVISARAFAPLERLLEVAERFSTGETLWLLPKGRSAADELASVQRSHLFHVEQSLTDSAAGVIVGTIPRSKGAAQ